MATNLYSLLIQMDLSSSRQKWQNIAPFSKRNHVWSSNQPVWNDHAFIVFLSLLSSATSFPLICSPSVMNYLQYQFVKRLPERGFVWKRKNYLVFEHAFVMVPTFFERNLHYVLHGVMLEWACHVFTRAWNALGTISGGKAAILNLLSKYPELDETLLKWFREKKSQDKSFTRLYSADFCQIVLQCLHKRWE